MVLAVLTALTACKPDTVDLAYTYPGGAQIHYELTAEAHAAWDIGGFDEGSYRVTFDVTEEVIFVNETGAKVAVTMTARDEEVEESGLPSPGTEPLHFTLRVGPTGEVLEVIDVGGVPAGELDPAQLIFIGTYRPPLPASAVRLDDTWAAPATSLPETFQQVVSNGRLTGYRKDGDVRLALISYDGSGPLVGNTQLPQGAAEMTGTMATEGDASIDIDSGMLMNAHSVTTGTLQVRVIAEQGELPINGAMDLRLELTVERVEPPS